MTARQIPEPMKLLAMGVSFFQASSSLIETGDKAVERQKLINLGLEEDSSQSYDILVMLPGVVNRALAAELFLKATYLYDLDENEQNEFEFTHHLKNLFDKLKSTTKEKIIKFVGVDHDEFITKLDTASNEFVGVRYMESGAHHMDFMKKLVGVLALVCFQKSPIKISAEIQSLVPASCNQVIDFLD